MSLTILEGSTFCICDELGDVGDETSGFFWEDTRFLSILRLTIDGHRPLLLSSDKVEYFSAAFFLRNGPTARLPQDTLSIMRRRFVGEAMQDSIVVQNQGSQPVSFELGIEIGCDFADIFAVKAHDFALGDPLRAPPLPPLVEPRFDAENNQFLLEDSEDPARTQVILSRPGRVEGSKIVYEIELRTAGNGGLARLPAAGMPWFMTVFGRDTVIAGLQTLILGTELARAALEVLAQLQATEDDPTIDAEPGKIVHEVRHGKAAKAWFRRYYGTVDATPLYLILLSEVWRWTDDAAFVRRMRGPALAALSWIDTYGDRDGDGFVEYQKRSGRGLDNQSWKDSGDSQRFADGGLAEPPIAPCEVQGYVYDAKRRMAEIAREVWRDRELAERLEREAQELRERFDAAYWTDARGGYYVLALDGEKRQVDSMCSNMGHLLWSAIVPSERADAVVDALMGEALWSGWGVRTMSQEDAAYNPLAYHNGTVWPHDNSIIAAGLARYARFPEALRIVQRTLEASTYFGHQLPEVFAGLPRAETPFPIAYPTAARPQAWAAGTPILLLQVLLGLQPNRNLHLLESVALPELPSWAGSLRLTGVRAFDSQWDVRLEEGQVRVTRA
jgi:glycogen debranching enzyme